MVVQGIIENFNMIIKCRSFRKGSSAFFFRICFCLLLPLPSSAQFIDSIWSSLHTRPSLTGEFGTNTSFINDFNSPMFNLYGGLDFNHYISTGLGLSWLDLSSYVKGTDNTPFYLDKVIISPLGKPDTVHPALRFHYFSWFVNCVFYKNNRWQFSIPLLLGLGNSKYEYDYNGKLNTENEHLIMLYQPSVSGSYRIFRWFGVGLDVGYRLMLINNDAIGTKFSSPVYNVYTIIYWTSLYKMLFPDTKLAKKIKE